MRKIHDKQLDEERFILLKITIGIFKPSETLNILLENKSENLLRCQRLGQCISSGRSANNNKVLRKFSQDKASIEVVTTGSHDRSKERENASKQEERKEVYTLKRRSMLA